MANKNNNRERVSMWVLDYLVDGKSQAEKVFSERKLKCRITERRGIKGYPNRSLVSMTFRKEDYDLFNSCFEQLCEDAPKEVAEDGLTMDRVMKENLLLISTVS